MEASKAQGIGCLLLLGFIAAGWLISAIGPAKPEFIPMAQDGAYAMIIPQGMEPAEMPIAAKERCGTATYCKVLGWTYRSKAARALPMLDDEVNALVFDYTLNRSGGAEEALWDCKRFPQADKASCL